MRCSLHSDATRTSGHRRAPGADLDTLYSSSTNMGNLIGPDVSDGPSHPPSVVFIGGAVCPASVAGTAVVTTIGAFVTIATRHFATISTVAPGPWPVAVASAGTGLSPHGSAGGASTRFDSWCTTEQVAACVRAVHRPSSRDGLRQGATHHPR